METPKEKVKEILENIDLDKHCKFSYQSSSSKTYKGRITLSVKQSDLNVDSFGFPKEYEFSIGSPDFCKMKLRIFPKGKTENTSNFVSFDIIFKEKLPNGSYFYSALSLINKKGDVLKSSVETDNGKDVDIINFDDFAPVEKLQDFLNEDKVMIVLFLKITSSIYFSHSDDAEYLVNDSYVMKLPTKKCIDKMPTDLKFLLEKEEMHTNKALLTSALPALQVVCKAIPPDVNELQMPKNLRGINTSMFKKIMNFALTENITFSSFAEACRLYNAATTFDMSKLMDVSATYLGGNISSKNLFVVEMLAQTSKNESLLEACFDFVQSCDTKELAHESMLG